ncbi:MAG TPA: prolyl oligopeptidase family serine peptidase [Vicinamibacterales bacterium]|nr:prolyl oligopeptidase family serine peptidase [Vicinamibacterales bacterium]
MRIPPARIASCVPLVLAAALATTVTGQQKPPVPRSDFGKFETLVVQQRGGLSPDGAWIAYGINRGNRENELRIAPVRGGSTTTVPYGTQPAFSTDSRYAAYAIGYSEAEEEKLREQKKPVHRKLGILTLATGTTATIDGIETFAFNASGSHLAMKRYASERSAPAEPAAGASEDPVGSTLIVRHLESGRDMTFGNVTEFAWQDEGALLALVIGAPDKTGNGVQLHDPRSGTVRVLDSAAETYSGLAWRKEADDLAVLRTRSDEGREGPTHVALAWRDVASSQAASTYDPTVEKDFPAGMRTVAFRRPSWSEDGKVVFLGIKKWDEKIRGDKSKTDNDGEPEKAEEPAGVEVWHAKDVDVMPRQKINARNDRQRNLLAAWHLESNRLVQLGTDVHERVMPVPRQPIAYAAHWPQYAMQRTIGRPAADLFLIDLATGARTPLKQRVADQYVQVSPGGRYILYLEADHFWTIDTATRATVNITRGVTTSFINRESDVAVPQKPPFGVAGWTAKDEAVILYDKFDLWRVAADGSGAVRLTSGAADEIRHRYVRLDPDEEWIDTSKPIYLSLFAPWTKKSGYARLHADTKQVERLVFLDKSVDRLARAEDADVYSYVVQAFDDPADAMVGGPSLSDAKAVTATNPFFGDYAWGRAELVDYKSDKGERLQGALFYPAAYEPGRKYPMVVYMYERLSDSLHRWTSPSPLAPYNASVFTSQGYFYFQPDIVFRPREPGLSVVECVGPAVRKVVAMGLADPARIGIIGHSWGGFDTVFLATNTKLFAAGVAGAPITNLVSNYGNHHWSGGIAETDHIETGQQRMEVPIWEDLPAYIRNSAVFGISSMTTPLLLAFGDNDGTVHWHQGVEYYNIARRARKDVVMLVYNGEDHGLRRKPNQIDYQQRILQWFGHYLKGEPAVPWITDGVSHLERQREVERLKGKKGTS